MWFDLHSLMAISFQSPPPFWITVPDEKFKFLIVPILHRGFYRKVDKTFLVIS